MNPCAREGPKEHRLVPGNDHVTAGDLGIGRRLLPVGVGLGEQEAAIAKLPGRFPAVPVAAVDGSGVLHVLITVGSGDPYHPPFPPLGRMLVSSSDGVHFGPAQLITQEPEAFENSCCIR